ncbi:MULTISPECIES: hypothetical protein [unclassified Microcoleus]|nr:MULTISPECIES: hypothetical protein [unclassified Microcoleus]MCC3421513.1 hypothetical protein [Microcoleus sp. PH2017_07_MST_O_A]MCC3503690.1 hypothetical protein [Microcoleus sp. PH2017_19_SFW_U_A]MCC3508326.1 hypothetical protein [Microcoleus sp. PH2017_17_BER_D_A]MCC3564479.1 hypothetical protein [Microcoleus sp. PH2017_31_RDM_U_A]MCC3523941.1 hypothetical protein [Microcoleus sp. PH2017_20_SFW_D_A]
MTGINLSSLPASLFFRRWLTNVVDYSDCGGTVVAGTIDGGGCGGCGGFLN